MSVSPRPEERPAEAVAGFLAAAVLAASFVALVYRPVRIAPFAITLALIAVGIGGRHSRLAALALGVATACFAGGLTIAVLTRHPLF
jgi:hypothetical protein